MDIIIHGKIILQNVAIVIQGLMESQLRVLGLQVGMQQTFLTVIMPILEVLV